MAVKKTSRSRAAKTKAPSRKMAKLRAGKTGIELLDNFVAVMKKFTVTAGRARRREFWMFVLAVIIIGFALGILIIIPVLGIIFGIASSIFGLVIIIPSITAGVRRLHDTNKTGWLMLLCLIPLIGGIIVLIMCVMEGTHGSNQYGPDPKRSKR